jgi:ankyrin repeat protein
MLCCVQSGKTALYWAARDGYVNIVQTLIDHSAAVDLGRDEVTNHNYLLTYGWSFGCGFIAIHASADSVYDHNIA